uniref:Pyridoxal phosphate phosphatase n=1 Tax=Timema genevievae TaxID=629358 RepID=A0A7R9JPV1_TIMGE|nr:unnamed protein product [Timema genevievae]
MENSFGKTTLGTPGRDSNLDLPVVDSLIYRESSALDHVATEMASPRFLAVFDFDNTITDSDTFYTVHEHLHTGKMPQEAENACIESIPSVPGLEDVLRFLENSGAEVIFISDANSVFIQDWLDAHKLSHTVRRIFTNPAHYDKDGCLQVEDYHVQDTCQLSTHNLCKGRILEDELRIPRNLSAFALREDKSILAGFRDKSETMNVHLQRRRELTLLTMT